MRNRLTVVPCHPTKQISSFHALLSYRPSSQRHSTVAASRNLPTLPNLAQGGTSLRSKGSGPNKELPMSQESAEFLPKLPVTEFLHQISNAQVKRVPTRISSPIPLQRRFAPQDTIFTDVVQCRENKIGPIHPCTVTISGRMTFTRRLMEHLNPRIRQPTRSFRRIAERDFRGSFSCNVKTTYLCTSFMNSASGTLSTVSFDSSRATNSRNALVRRSFTSSSPVM